MYDDDERNEQYIGDRLKDGKVRLFLSRHILLTQIIGSLLALFLLLKVYGGFAAAKNFFGQEAPETNPVKLLLDAAGNHPVFAILMLALSYIAGRIIASLVAGERVSRFEENARGETIDNMGQHGRGRIADLEEISKVFTFTDDDHTLGTIIGEHPENGKVICKEYVEPGKIKDYVHQLKNDHMLLAAPSSSGKTTNFIPQNIINHMKAGHSLITTDPSGELYSLLAPVCRYLGYKVRILNLRPDEMPMSDGCDILKPLRDSLNPESMADDFCAAILRNVTGGKTDDFWNKGNINLLSLVLLYVSHAKNFRPLKAQQKRDEHGNLLEPGPKERVFREVAAYIEDPVALESNIEAAIKKDPLGDGDLLVGRFNTWKTNKEKVQICTGLSTSLSIFRNRWVREILSQDDMSVDQLVTDKVIYFIVMHPLGEAFQSVTSLYFTTVFSELFRLAFKCRGNRLPHMVYIFLEEFQTLGLLISLPATLDNIRKHNVGIALCTQELAMVEEIYGTGTTINMLNDCLVQMCMGTNADYPGGGIITNASYFGKMSGTQTISETYVTEQRHKWIPERIQEVTVLEQSQRAQSSSEEVYRCDDVYRIKGDEVLVRTSMHNPFMAKRFFWKRHPLSDIVVQNRYTKEEFELKTCDHVPHYKSGTDELFDTDIYELVNKKPKKPFTQHPAYTQSAPAKKTSGVSYDKFL